MNLTSNLVLATGSSMDSFRCTLILLFSLLTTVAQAQIQPHKLPYSNQICRVSFLLPPEKGTLECTGVLVTSTTLAVPAHCVRQAILPPLLSNLAHFGIFIDAEIACLRGSLEETHSIQIQASPPHSQRNDKLDVAFVRLNKAIPFFTSSLHIPENKIDLQRQFKHGRSFFHSVISSSESKHLHINHQLLRLPSKAQVKPPSDLLPGLVGHSPDPKFASGDLSGPFVVMNEVGEFYFVGMASLAPVSTSHLGSVRRFVKRLRAPREIVLEGHLVDQKTPFDGVPLESLLQPSHTSFSRCSQLFLPQSRTQL